MVSNPYEAIGRIFAALSHSEDYGDVKISLNDDDTVKILAYRLDVRKENSTLLDYDCCRWYVLIDMTKDFVYNSNTDEQSILDWFSWDHKVE